MDACMNNPNFTTMNEEDLMEVDGGHWYYIFLVIPLWKTCYDWGRQAAGKA